MLTKSRPRFFVNFHKKITKSQKNHKLPTYVGNTWMWIHKFVSAERNGNAPLIWIASRLSTAELLVNAIQYPFYAQSFMICFRSDGLCPKCPTKDRDWQLFLLLIQHSFHLFLLFMLWIVNIWVCIACLSPTCLDYIRGPTLNTWESPVLSYTPTSLCISLITLKFNLPKIKWVFM